MCGVHLLPELRITPAWLVGLGLVVAAVSAEAADPGAAVDYVRDVQPVLSDACYHCHGPDQNTREANLRLDTKEGAFRLRKGKAVIIPGDAGKSELIRRITATDPDDHMPPPDSNRKLTARQIELLKKWVEQGAKWNEHWAFVPPVRAALPRVKRADWARNAIDRFVLARLEGEGLGPSAEATREALVRRLTFDLTGLPPTVEEVESFVKDPLPEGAAWEKVVDRLLASSRYGERMATDWLDLARYADTHGYQMDRYRATWQWRDWVIKAFNQNLPFDQFVTWQLAGDLLPNATKEQRLATAFNRQHSQNEEGGIVEEEFRVAYVVDRVNTMGTAFLGLTFECSRCHDHKYDPISQKDFYQLFAFFQNIDESGQTTYFTESTPVPTMLLSTDEQDRKIEELRRKIESKEGEIRAARDGAKDSFGKWLVERRSAASTPTPTPTPTPIASFSFDEIRNNKTPNAVDEKKPGNAVEGPKTVAGKHGNAAGLSGENGFTFPKIGTFSRADPFTLSIWLKSAVHAPRYTVVHHSKAPIDAGSRGYELLLEDGRVALGLHHMWPGNSVKVVTKQAIAANEWAHVAVTYDGSSRAAGVRVFVDGVAQDLQVVRDNLYKDITYENGEPDLAIGYRFRDNGFKGGQVDEFKVFDRALTSVEVAQLAGVTKDATRDARFEYFIANVHQPAIELEKQLHALRTEQTKIVNPIPEAMVMRELPAPKPACVLKRGAYDAPGDKVVANTPAALPALKAREGSIPNRLDLARWLLEPDHPLTARVTVNRLWQQMFGHGIVETSDNFGRQGTPPTHPELLDHLAQSFVDEMKWDVKRMLKTIAMSATYRQSSKRTPELLARDPANHLLARGPARRLTAEMLRDQALAASGLLVEKLGGPSVKPYQPPGLWEEIAMGRPKYDQGKGADLYRRSLYTFWKRTVPPPAMTMFDAADRSVCTVKRQATSTPLQALALLNDVQLVEAARFVAQRMLKEGGDTLDARVSWAFKLVTGRSPNDRETTVLKQLYNEQRDLFGAEPESAKKLLAVGETRNDKSLDALDFAAGTVLAQAILNHDEAVMRR
jgi:mono/diheme cytochrome c family protein